MGDGEAQSKGDLSEAFFSPKEQKNRAAQELLSFICYLCWILSRVSVVPYQSFAWLLCSGAEGTQPTGEFLYDGLIYERARVQFF